MARILIDGRFVGVGDSQTRYVLELVKNILKIDHENDYTLLLRPVGLKELENFPGIKEKTNLKIQILDIPHYSLNEQTKFLKYLKKEKFDLVHFTQFNHPILYRGKYVTTIQDLTLIGHLHRQNLVKKIAFNRVMKSAACDSSQVIVISKTTMNDVFDYYPKAKKDKFTLIYHGMDHGRFNAQVKSQKSKVKSFKEKYRITGDYILYTGMWKKHKNVMRMLLAFERITGKKKVDEIHTQLVLVGKIDSKEPEIMDEINRLNNSSKYKDAHKKVFITTGFIAEEELPIAYAGATAYCIPSLSEGFGWPPLEAMACGTPVIASKESCMPEILGDAALYFDPYNIDDMSAKMGDISTNEVFREKLVQKGLKKVQKYHWEECARKTLEVYKKALKK